MKRKRIDLGSMVAWLGYESLPVSPKEFNPSRHRGHTGGVVKIENDGSLVVHRHSDKRKCFIEREDRQHLVVLWSIPA